MNTPTPPQPNAAPSRNVLWLQVKVDPRLPFFLGWLPGRRSRNLGVYVGEQRLLVMAGAKLRLAGR